MKHLLIIDDEYGSRESLRMVFSGKYRITTAESAAKALDVLAKEPIDLIFSDVIMPEKDGVALLREVQERYPEVPVIMVSASTSVRPVVDAMRQGAFDFVTKPFDIQEIRLLAERALASSALNRKVEVFQRELSREFPVEGIVGQAPCFLACLQNAQEAADTDATILLTGESGTGKELVARRIHSHSNRLDEPFIAVHCAALPEQLLESELFGHEKGAFTNAAQRKLGRFDLAGSGTLFFDEVGEMSTSMQVKLLRVLQEREFMRVGGTRVIRTNARIIAATNRDLKKEVEEGRFREDLYYRLNVVPIHLPPLRDRREDIALLSRYFLDYFRSHMDLRTRDFEPEAIERLCRYRWPGNVRELRNVLERTLVLHRRQPLVLAEFLPEEFQNARNASAAAIDLGDTTLEAALSAYEKRLLEEALKKAGGVQTRAARMLGTTRRILRYRMEKLNIPVRPARRAAR